MGYNSWRWSVMINNVKESFTKYYKSNNPEHVYPTEWVIRTFLGTYPSLALNNNNYCGAKILDIGFGDGRNWSLFNNLKLDIYGIEITESIVELGKKRSSNLGINTNLRIGSNTNIPFENGMFDFILACHSCYYIDSGTTFVDNLIEYSRVLKPRGCLIVSLPETNTVVLDGSIEREKGYFEIVNDPWGLRNGYLLRCFDSEQEIKAEFTPYFDSFAFGLCRDNYYGTQINIHLCVCRKKQT